MKYANAERRERGLLRGSQRICTSLVTHTDAHATYLSCVGLSALRLLNTTHCWPYSCQGVRGRTAGRGNVAWMPVKIGALNHRKPSAALLFWCRGAYSIGRGMSVVYVFLCVWKKVWRIWRQRCQFERSGHLEAPKRRFENLNKKK